VASGLVTGALLPGFEVDVPTPTDAGLLPPLPKPPVVAQTQQWQAIATGGVTDFVEKTHALLVQLKNKAQLIDVFGSKQTEYSMVIEELVFHRGDDTGTGEEITIGLKKVRIVQTQTVAAPIPNLPAGGGKPPAKKGAQQGSTGGQKDSAAFKLATGMGASFR
jgi:hypothetical protein